MIKANLQQLAIIILCKDYQFAVVKKVNDKK
jgi:hypothetical protein